MTAKKDNLLLDFGSGSTRLYKDGKLVSSAKSFFSEFQANSYHKFHLVDRGTITHFDFATNFLNKFLEKQISSGLISSRFKGYYLAPEGLTQVEELIIKKVLSSLQLGSWKILSKKNIIKTKAGLVIDVGFDSTEVVLGMGTGEIKAKTINFGSRFFTQTIRKVVRDNHQLEVSWLGAEKIKKELAGDDFLLSVNKSKQKITVRGKDIYTFVPKTIVVEASIFQKPLLERVEEIFEEIKLFFSKISTNLLMNSIEKGLELWGDGSKMAGVDSFFAQKLQTKVKVTTASYEVQK